MVNSCSLSNPTVIAPNCGSSEVIVNVAICSPSKRLSFSTLKLIQFSGEPGVRSTESENP